MTWLKRLIRTIGRKVICTCPNPERCPKFGERASGGPIAAGRTYLIGEHGPGPLILPRNVTSPCNCVTTETTPAGQHTPRTFNINTSACDKHRKNGYR